MPNENEDSITKLSGTMKAVPRGTFRNKDIHLKQSSPTYLNVTSQCSEKKISQTLEKQIENITIVAEITKTEIKNQIIRESKTQFHWEYKQVNRS